jgi:hypothetical protein
MTRKFEDLTKRLDEGYLKDMKAAAECRMCSRTAILKPVRHLIVAYSDIATPPRTTEPPGARHARWYMRREFARGGSSAYHLRGMHRCLSSRAPAEAVHGEEPSPTHPPRGGNGAAGVGGVVDQRTRDTDYAKATGRERRCGRTTFYRKSISTETQRSSKRATISPRPRSSHQPRTRCATTRG